MKKVVPLSLWIVLAFTLVSLTACKEKTPAGKRSIAVGTSASLAAHTAVFEKGVVKVDGTDNVHVAIGFGLANSILIEGDDGLIIVDTMETREEAARVLAAFRAISPKPIAAIIYTHNHADHIFGADVFAADGSPKIYAHDTTAEHVKRLLNKMRPAIGTRSMRMFGLYLDEAGLVNAGIGPHLGFGPESTVGFVPPTHTFSERLADEVAGVSFELVHAPGETDDQLFVWLSEQKVLLPGDNFYWSFPNLYTIRGTPFRSMQRWVRSLDAMRDLGAEVMVPSHTRPVIGADRIEAILTHYRDAIQFVHDQSVRGMNLGMTPDELAETVVLPPHLRDLPYLQPYYGKPPWSARSMFTGHLGWFDGDSATLQPLTRREKASLMARIAGGEAELLRHAREALSRGEPQAALELTGHLVRLNPDDREAREIRVEALVALGEREENANARHYYLTEALEIRDGFVAREMAKATPETLARFSLAGFFELLAVSLDARASLDVDKRIGLRFPDAGEAYTIHVRRGIAEIRSRTPEMLDAATLDIEVIADSQAWKEMLAKLRSPVTTLAGFEYPKGNMFAFAKILEMFELPEPKLPYEPLPHG